MSRVRSARTLWGAPSRCGASRGPGRLGGAVTDPNGRSVSDDQYGVQALSLCFPGDPDEL